MHLTTYVNRRLSGLQRKSVEPMALVAGGPPRTLRGERVFLRGPPNQLAAA
jgi:hypothetical protein